MLIDIDHNRPIDQVPQRSARNSSRGRSQTGHRQHLATLAGADLSVALITTADQLHNARRVAFDLRSQGEAVWSRFNGGREGTLWHYGEALKVLRPNPNAPMDLVEEFARTVDEVRELAG